MAGSYLSQFSVRPILTKALPIEQSNQSHRSAPRGRVKASHTHSPTRPGHPLHGIPSNTLRLACIDMRSELRYRFGKDYSTRHYGS